MTQTEGRERRRFARVPLRLEAYVALGGQPAMPCTVLDFCPAGLFVATAPDALGGATAGTAATLYFALVIDGQQREFQLSLTIRRVTGSGLGVAFERPDPEAVERLGQLAGVPAAGSEAETETKAGGPVKRPYRKVADKVADLARAYYPRFVGAFLKHADHDLFIAARDAESNVDQQRCLDMQSALKKRDSELRMRVLELWLKGIENVENPVDDDALVSEPSRESEALSLVDKDEFEEFLVVSEAISVLEPKYRDALFELNARFSHMTGREITDTSNPVGPAVICQCLATELHDLPGGRRALGVVFRALVKSLSEYLDDFYRELNRLLVDHDVLPVIPREKLRKTESTRSRLSDTRSTLSETRGTLGLDMTGGSLESSDPLRDSRGPAQGGTTYGPAPGAGSYHPGGPPSSHPAGGQSVYPASPSPPAGAVGAPPAGWQPRGVEVAAPAGSGGPAAPESGGLPTFDPTGGGHWPQVNPPGMRAEPAPAGGGQVAPAPGYQGPSGGVAPAPGYQGPPGAVAPAVGYQGPSGQVAPASGYAGPGGGQTVSGGGVPSLGVAYSAAQRMLDLRRQFQPLSGTFVSTGGDALGAFASGEIVEELSDLQRSIARIDSPGILSVDQIKRRIADRAAARSGKRKRLDPEQADVIEVVANLLTAMVNDVLVSGSAKKYLSRMQVPIHKLALMDEGFFTEESHPARQVVDRVAQLTDTFVARPEAQGVLDEMVNDVNEEFTDDPAVIEDAIGELERLLGEQRSEYKGRVSEVIADCEKQQAVLKERRGESKNRAAAERDLPREWHRWLERGKALAVGEHFLQNPGTPRETVVSLAWVGDDFDPYVFVDEKGEKVATLTLQQVAMYLKRGLLKPVANGGAGPVERALQGLVGNMHIELDERIGHDTLTEFLHLSNFISAVDQRLDNLVESGTAVFALVDLRGVREINQKHGREAGDSLIKRFAADLRNGFTNQGNLFGRLSGDKFAMYLADVDMETAYQRLDDLLRAYHLEGHAYQENVLKARGFAGLLRIDDKVESAEGLIDVARAACQAARQADGKYVYVSGQTPSKQRVRLEQLVDYIAKALDRNRLVMTARDVVTLNSDAPGCREIRISVTDRQGKLVPSDYVSEALPKSPVAAQVDNWLISAVLKWVTGVSENDDRFVMIPLSSASLQRDELTQDIMAELMTHPVPPGRLCFLLDNHTVSTHLGAAQDLTRSLREFGCRFALDQFGSGQTSYDYLRELSLDFVVIQSSFVKNMAGSEKDAAMVKSIRELAHFTGLKTYIRADDDDKTRTIATEAGIDYFCPNIEAEPIEIKEPLNKS